MKISYNWLKEYIDTNLKPQEIGEILTSIGLEVENIEPYETVKGGLEGLVIGEVIECAKHPDADKLSVTKVDVGKGKLLDIVCGAPNVAKGQKVVVATEGTVLYRGNESFTIKKTKLRGEPSEGMICAEDEIGLGTSHDGIMVLNNSARTGTPAKDYFNVKSDTIFEIGLTPNRIDSASHYGVARDLAAFLKMNDKVTLRKPDVSAFKPEDNKHLFSVEIKNPELCPRYSGLYISGVQVKQSPEWLQTRLKAIGLNPINNIVDITNFVAHELGQPLHAFDADLLKGKKIIIKTPESKTKFTTLDNAVHDIDTEDLMIYDTERPVAIAGAFGGLETGVTNQTMNIFLESAYFDPTSVRKTSKKHGINTDASFRCERGTDPEGTVFAIKRAALLIKEHAEGKLLSDIIDNYPNKQAGFKVKVKYKNIDRLIGKRLQQSTIVTILDNLEISIIDEDEESLTLQVPPYRVDVQREADVIEEILRIYGYNNVEIPQHVNSTLTYTPHPDFEKYNNGVSNLLSNNGFAEIMCNSLTKSAYYEKTQTFHIENTVKLENALSADLDSMRQTLLFGGLEAIVHNTNRQNPNLRLYEFGNCYFYNDENKKSPLDKYSEGRRLGIFLAGLKNEKNWNNQQSEISFFDLKQYVQLIFDHIGLHNTEFKELSGDIFAYGLECNIGKTKLGMLGSVNKTILKQFDIKKNVYMAELDWDEVVNAVKDNAITFTELPRFPEVKRDLALLLDKKITFSQVKDLALKTEKKLLKSINLFDIYEGDKLEEGKKSYAVSFTLQDASKTLTESDIDGTMKRLMEAYRKELNAEIR